MSINSLRRDLDRIKEKANFQEETPDWKRRGDIIIKLLIAYSRVSKELSLREQQQIVQDVVGDTEFFKFNEEGELIAVNGSPVTVKDGHVNMELL